MYGRRVRNIDVEEYRNGGEKRKNMKGEKGEEERKRKRKRKRSKWREVEVSIAPEAAQPVRLRHPLLLAFRRALALLRICLDLL